jgi:hypothetical protein
VNEVGAQWQPRPRLIKAVNITTRTSHYKSFTMSGTGYMRNNRPATRLDLAGEPLPLALARVAAVQREPPHLPGRGKLSHFIEGKLSRFRG